MRRAPLVRLLAFALLLFAAPVVQAAHFDLIYVDHFDLTLCTNGCSLTLGDASFGLIVNEGASFIYPGELLSASFSSTSSHPDFSLYPFVNDPNIPTDAPVFPQEAVGAVVAPYNSVLLGELHPGETFRNIPGQFLVFQVSRLSGAYEGPVQFNVTMSISGEEVQFVMIANVHVGDSDLQFTSAARTSSVPLPVPAARTSWGKVKALYN